jgi:tetratricopeptide (TPR) repeat protein
MKKFVATLLVAPLLASSAPAMAAVAGPYAGPHAAIGLGAVQFRAALAPEAASAPASAPSPSSETETFEVLVAQATEKFKDKDYAGAVALFERAYQQQKEPAILFNIGRIYEEAQNAEAAIGYYEKFIADESVELKDREKAVQRLQVLKTIVEIREKEKQKANPQPPVQPNPVVPPPQTDPKQLDKQPDKQTQPNRLLRPVGYAMFGTGALLVIGGAIAGGLARGQERAAADAETLDDREAANQLGRSRAITADALFITGGLVAAIGVVLLVVPALKKARTDKARATRSLTPHVSPTQVGLGFTHRF